MPKAGAKKLRANKAPEMDLKWKGSDEDASDVESEGSLSEGEIPDQKTFSEEEKEEAPVQKRPGTGGGSEANQTDVKSSELDDGQPGEVEIAWRAQNQQPKKEKKRRICKRWLYSKCRRGDKCPYFHEKKGRKVGNFKDNKDDVTDKKPKTLYATVYSLLYALTQ